VQLTPPGSACSIQLVRADSPAALLGLYLVTADLEAERTALLARGVEVGPIRHKQPIDRWVGEFRPGPDAARRDYASFADFADPDGNTWILQERR
jgi:hypothetical protein